ncbi:hypothetical protein [Geodermatophilus sp. SYSU D01105]
MSAGRIARRSPPAGTGALDDGLLGEDRGGDELLDAEVVAELVLSAAGVGSSS